MTLSRAAMLGAACICLAACASPSKDIGPAYASPLQYRDYDCNQIAQESQRVSARVTELAVDLDNAASNDSVAVGVGLAFPPALLFIAGNGPEATEYSQLKGQSEALAQTSVEKKCS